MKCGHLLLSVNSYLHIWKSENFTSQWCVYRLDLFIFLNLWQGFLKEKFFLSIFFIIFACLMGDFLSTVWQPLCEF